MTNDTCCTIVPYFKIAEGKVDAFKAICERFVEKTRSEKGCLYYGFAFDGQEAFCREGYVDGPSVLAHLESVGPLIEEALQVSELLRLEIHGPEAELAKIREPLKDLNPRFFVLEYGFRN